MDTPVPSQFMTRQSAPLQTAENAAGGIARVKYTHDAMIDLMIANPVVSQGQLAIAFGYTQAWVSRVINSDAFMARLAERKRDIVDPTIALTLEEKFKTLANLSTDILIDKLLATKNPDTALRALEITGKALGYGARQQNLNVQQNFVVAMPAQSASPEAWAASHKERMTGVRSPDLLAIVEDVSASGS